MVDQIKVSGTPEKDSMGEGDFFVGNVGATTDATGRVTVPAARTRLNQGDQVIVGDVDITGDEEVSGSHKAASYEGNGVLLTSVPSAGVGGTSSETSLTLQCNSANGTPAAKIVGSKFSQDLFQADENGFSLKTGLPFSHEDDVIPFNKPLDLQNNITVRDQNALNSQVGPSAGGNGSTSFFQVANNVETQFSTQDGGLRFWFRTPKGADYSGGAVTLLDNRVGSGNGFICSILTTNILRFTFDSGTSYFVESDNTVNDGAGHCGFIGLDRNGNMTMDLDGVPQSSPTAIDAVDANNVNDLFFLSDGGASGFADVEMGLIEFYNYLPDLGERKALSSNHNQPPRAADEGASNVNIITGVDANWGTDAADITAFNIAYSWAAGLSLTSIAVASNVMTVVGDTGTKLQYLNIGTANKNERITINASAVSGTWIVRSLSSGVALSTITTTGLKTVSFLSEGDDFIIESGSVGASLSIDCSATEIGLINLGVTAHYPGSNLVFDSDGNALYWKDNNPAANHAVGTDVVGANISEQITQVSGTFTASVLLGGASTGIVISAQECKYIKSGSQVTAWGRVAFDKGAASTGSLTIGGLPFTAVNNTSLPYTASIYTSRVGAAGETVSSYLTDNTTTMTFRQIPQGTGASTDTDDTDIIATGTDAVVIFSVTYETND